MDISTCTEVVICSTDHYGSNRMVQTSFLESIPYFCDYSWTDGIDRWIAEADHSQGVGQPQTGFFLFDCSNSWLPHV